MDHTGSRVTGQVSPVAQYQQTPNTKSPIFSLHADKRSGKFISHLLGLDHEQQSGNSSLPKASSVLKGVKLSDFFQGVKITPNFMFFLLFLGFFLWIFVIYWVRHHEPLANQVLGPSKAHAHKAALDRKLVAGIKNAFPVQTSATTGEVYVPGSPATPPPASLPIQYNSAANSSVGIVQAQVFSSENPYGNPSAQPATVIAAPAQGQVLPAIHAGVVVPVRANAPDLPASTIPIQSHAAAGAHASALPVQPSVMHTAVPVTEAIHVGQGNYMVGVQTNSGTRVKTIVSR